MAITMKEALEANEFHEVGWCARNRVRRWRRNGKTQVWVTRPNDFRIPVKFGLYDFGQITHLSADHYHTADQCPVLLAIQEAEAHGHPRWSHLFAHGPCTILSSFADMAPIRAHVE